MMLKLATLLFFVAAAAAGTIQPAVEPSTNTESDMEGAATHHGFYEKNIGLYAGAMPAVYPGGYGGGYGGGYPALSAPYYQSAYPVGYPSAYPSYSSGYGGGYGYPYRPYPSFGVGVFAG